MPATDDQIKDWCHLRTLTDEMELAYGEPEKGIYEAKLAALTRFAWDECWDEQKRRIEAMAVPREQPQ